MKRFIEADFPIRAVSEHSAREKNIRHGHISTLHIRWARRPGSMFRRLILTTFAEDDIRPTELWRRVHRRNQMTAGWEDSW